LNIQATHRVKTLEAAEYVKANLSEGNRVEKSGRVATFYLGLSDVADKLGPAVDKVINKLRA
jgi:hypothetical protein